MDYHGFGLGCAQMRTQNSQENSALIGAAMDEGVTFFNTADFYGAGESEMALGEALKGYSRDAFYVSLKFGALMAPNGTMYGLDVHPSRIRNYLTHSLKRLKLDYIDLYQPARIDLGIPVEETVGVIADLVKEGYVRHIGVTQVDTATLERANAVHPIEAVELEYSLFNRGIEADVMPAARRLGIKVVAFGVLAHGLLNGSWTRERLEQGTCSPYGGIPLFAEENLEKNITLVENLQCIADEKQVSVSQLAHAWALSKGGDVIPLIGTGNPAHFREAQNARDLILSEEDISRIERSIPADQISGDSFRRMLFRNGALVTG